MFTRSHSETALREALYIPISHGDDVSVLDAALSVDKNGQKQWLY